MMENSRAAVPPPLVFFGALLIGVVLNALRPLPMFNSSQIGDLLGLLAALASAALAYWALRTMLRAGERPDPGLPTKAIVRQGPFTRTRNPIYISFALFVLGVALLLNNLWMVLALSALMVYVDIGIVRREERYLEQQFGEEYMVYKRNVRRWL